MPGDLHLNDLEIKGFRCINSLRITPLRRVTLLVGENGVGKTTVLDALRIYARHGSLGAFNELLENRDEYTSHLDTYGNKRDEIDWSALFYGRNLAKTSSVVIGERNSQNCLYVSQEKMDEEEIMRINNHPKYGPLPTDAVRVQSKFQDHVVSLPLVFSKSDPTLRYIVPEHNTDTLRQALIGSNRPIPDISCQSIGPNLISNVMIESLWDNVVLTEDESKCVEALNLLYPVDVTGVAVRRGRPHRSSYKLAEFDKEPDIRVKMSDMKDPVSLKSLGDGAKRFFGTALVLANSKNGFLLIDEAENGLHYTVQKRFWLMVLHAARENNVQVVATTHGRDAVVAFAQAAVECDDIGASLIRLQKEEEGFICTVRYSRENLEFVAQDDIEVR